MTKVTTLFPHDVLACILAIPVIGAEIRDELIWRFNKDGIYSARSGYVDGTRLELVAGAEEVVRWSLIWDLHVLQRVMHFLWKLVHGILPTSINLISHFVDVDPICKRCGRETETAEHLFRSCDWVREFWESSAVEFGQFNSLRQGECCGAWALAVLEALPGVKQRAIFSIFLWKIWFSRNQLVFEKKQYTHGQIIESANSLLSEFCGARPEGVSRRSCEVLAGWNHLIRGGLS
ncbi:hypothetical protein ACS0TY_006976 [Phlomoides rotata]